MSTSMRLVRARLARGLHWVDNAEELIGQDIDVFCCFCLNKVKTITFDNAEQIRECCDRDTFGNYLPKTHDGDCGWHYGEY